jgi:hypothetical protein
MDTGLIYKMMPESVYQATCLTSHRALLKYYFNMGVCQEVWRVWSQPFEGTKKLQEYVNNVLYQGVEFTAFRLWSLEMVWTSLFDGATIGI